MKIGLFVDGDAEVYALPKLLPRLGGEHQVLNPIYADLQPRSAVGQVASRVLKRAPIVARKHVDRAIVLLDLDDRQQCVTEWAQQLAIALNQRCGDCGIPQFQVVIKDRCFENWLVSDLDALAGMPRRFAVQQRHRLAVEPNRADRADGIVLMKDIVRGSYSKREDAARICERAAPDIMGRHSRSFRRFLRLAGHPSYRNQSKQPI